MQSIRDLGHQRHETLHIAPYQTEFLQGGAAGGAPAERHPDLLAAKADAMASRGDFQGAASAFAAALAVDGQHLASLVGRALCCAHLQRWQ